MRMSIGNKFTKQIAIKELKNAFQWKSFSERFSGKRFPENFLVKTFH